MSVQNTKNETQKTNELLYICNMFNNKIYKFNLKVRFAVWFAVFVAVIISITAVIIYFQSAAFRKEEFYLRLRQKSLTTNRLLTEVTQIDIPLLKIIDKNNLNALTDQKVFIFNDSFKLIYSNVNTPFEEPIAGFLEKIKTQKEIRITTNSHYETLGLWEENRDRKSIIVASAYDTYGLRQLKNLRNIIVSTWIVGLFLSIYLSYLYVRRIIGYPLASLTQKIAAINEQDLTMRVEVPDNEDELTILAANFNEMLERLEKSFESQRAFVQYASHELRTPLANMLAETEMTLAKDRDNIFYKSILQSLREDQVRLVDLTNALLLISRYEKVKLPENTPLTRIDEVLYNTIEEIRIVAPQYNIRVAFYNTQIQEQDLIKKANESLLKTVFRNLIENACYYSENNAVNILIAIKPEGLVIFFDNMGEILSKDEAQLIFTPFFRGKNTKGKKGIGLGLVLAQRIMNIHQGYISYEAPALNINRFILTI